MAAAAELERNPVSKHQISLSIEMTRLTRDGLPKPSGETKFSGVNGDREMFVFPVQLTTSRIGNLTRLILTLAICDDQTSIPESLDSLGLDHSDLEREHH